MNTTHEEKKATQELLHKTRIYLLDNFHKFSEFNKIKIALALNLKAMPTTIEGEVLTQHNITNIIYPENWKPKEERKEERNDGSKTQTFSSRFPLQP